MTQDQNSVPGSPWQQGEDQRRTIADEGGMERNGAPFQRTRPPQYTTPTEQAPPGLAGQPAQQAEFRATEIITIEDLDFPLAWLAVVEGKGGRRGQTLTLKSETIVGRTEGDLRLTNDEAASGRHLKIKFEEDKQAFVLYDQASSNGTYVGDRETYQDDESRVYNHVLKDGDFILVSETTLVFKQV